MILTEVNLTDTSAHIKTQDYSRYGRTLLRGLGQSTLLSVFDRMKAISKRNNPFNNLPAVEKTISLVHKKINEATRHENLDGYLEYARTFIPEEMNRHVADLLTLLTVVGTTTYGDSVGDFLASDSFLRSDIGQIAEFFLEQVNLLAKKDGKPLDKFTDIDLLKHLVRRDFKLTKPKEKPIVVDKSSSKTHEISTRHQHLLEITTSKNNWQEAGYMATNLGLYEPPPGCEWIVINSTGQPNRNALIMVYKNYRFYFLGDKRLLQHEMSEISSEGEIGKNTPDGKLITIVARKNNLLLPQGFIKKGEPDPHRRLTIDRSALSGNLALLSEKQKGVRRDFVEKAATMLHVKLPDKATIRSLKEVDLQQIENLLRAPDDFAGTQSQYDQGVWFDSRRLLAGLPYLGMFVGDKLVSIVGTHGMVKEAGVATWGDAFTSIENRGKGYATLLTFLLINNLFNSGYDRLVTDIQKDKPWHKSLINNLGMKHWGLIYYQDAIKTTTD